MTAVSSVPKVALVTGGARRIGRCIVEHLAGQGCAVAIHCRRSTPDAEDLARRIRDGGGRAAVVEAELTDPAALAHLMPQARAALGPVDCLINNASTFEVDTIESLTAETWEHHFAANLRAPVFLARDLAAQLPDGQEGCIVNVIDQRVWKLTPQFFSYTLTKAALWTATRTLAQALAPRIRVNAVGPGPTLASVRQDPDDFARQSAAVPLQHGASPDEVAEAVGYLVRARSVTGQMIAVDGGQHLAWRTPDVTDLME